MGLHTSTGPQTASGPRMEGNNGAHDPRAGRGPSLGERFKHVEGLGGSATLEDIRGLFSAILTEAHKPTPPGRQGTELTAERSERINAIVRGFRKTLALQLLDHGVDKASELIIMTAIAQLISEINNDLHPGFRERIINSLSLVEMLT